MEKTKKRTNHGMFVMELIRITLKPTRQPNLLNSQVCESASSPNHRNKRHYSLSCPSFKKSTRAARLHSQFLL